MANIVEIDPLLPPEVAERAEKVGTSKVRLDPLSTVLLAILAGAFIAMGAQFSTVVTTESGLGFGMSRLLGGVAFSLGLILVVIAGAELFTGNNLIVMAWASRKITTTQLLSNWGLVYAGNFLGATATVGLIFLSRQWEFDGHQVGATALRIANAKVNLGISEAFFLGIFANALVCLAVWLAYSARSNTDKILAIVFPITAFVAGGFEHSVANMYFIPMGLYLKGEETVMQAAGLTASDLSGLTWPQFFLENLLPVTLGNIVGGAVMVGAIYWFIYLRPSRWPSGG